MKIKLYGSLWVGVQSDLGGRKGGLQLYRREVTFVWRVREQKESVSLERAQLAEGTKACYGNSKSPLWAPVAEWKVLDPLANWGQSWGVCACGGRRQPRAQGCHEAGLGGGGQPHQGGAFIFLLKCFPMLA